MGQAKSTVKFKKILVVDDDKDTLEIIEEMLKPYGYEVITAEDGPHAIEKTNQHHLDLILLDNRMPFFSGIWYCDFLKRKANTKNIPVILVSSGLDEDTIGKARQMGASDFLKKPFQTTELLQIVQKHTS